MWIYSEYIVIMDNKLKNDFFGSVINKLKTLNKIKDNLGEKKDNTDDAHKKSNKDTDFLMVGEKVNDIFSDVTCFAGSDGCIELLVCGFVCWFVEKW